MPQEFGKILASWNVKEYEPRNRSLLWYIGLGLIAVFLLVYSIVIHNYLFVMIILLAAFILRLQHKAGVNRVSFQCTSKGIRIGNRTYDYKDLRNFWVIYNPPEVKKLYFTFKSSLSPRLMIPLRNQNPLKIREILLKFMEEDLDKEEEPISEIFAKWSKL